MPSVLPSRVSRDIIATKSWREFSQSQHIRSESTAQSTKLWEEDLTALEFLYPGSVEAKRRAERYSGIQVAQQRHKEPALIPKNDASQDQTYVPTQNDYPDLPGTVFTNPKAHIHNAMRGKAIEKIEFIEPKNRSNRTVDFRCTVSYTSLEGDILGTGIGEGSNKVILAIELMNSLTLPRNLLRRLHL